MVARYCFALALSTALLAHVASAQKCPLIWDGRVTLRTTPADFDKNSSIYDHQYVHGENQTWAEIIKFPVVEPSLFDVPKLSKPVEVTLSDASIFLSGPGGLQTGFRRSELIPATNNGTDPSVIGTTTFHWSIRNDPARPLNYSHEYHPAWHETNSYDTEQFTFETGQPFNQSFDPSVHNPRTLRLAGNREVSPENMLFQTPFTENVWHNWAVTLGWDSKTRTPEKGRGPGGGQFHVGVFKQPTGPLGINVLYEGYQESHINEGLIHGGVFIEDSSKGCVTTSLL
ncbi:hypothetical protein PUNSTDRAFT_128217 [Punctularia strigosozonata HHB-11173 SS5]|uniref:Glycoside hydrolase 131 catalytic N-terminal domain-containing protein n=1 Tax=Punctularia strigosozonata (strain HHB-11173) TaxID=741275 RepID=R7S483_PUNST|nr:uncharacterized protein PUNSTDRAFT_128217 [Punctularia strigosozonata HHB-11173 SS5]EIN04659.1 hypothetical protein PUNSTDRAFT_128217 [Punctularia strigosozonata HHB-11173 SS5]